MTHIPRLNFHDGHSIPQFGLGIWQLPEDETARIVSDAIGLGYRLIDGAVIYGNEAGLGEGILRADVARDDLFITSKVWNDMQGYDYARKSIEGSLARIGLDRLDLILIHWPCPEKDQYVETWKALIDAQKDGQVTSIGVSNFHAPHLDRIIGETGVTPVLNQIEVHPKLQQVAMRAVDSAREIVTQSWSPLGRAQSFDAAVIAEIAKRTGKRAAQVILRWHIELGNSVIARSTKTNHLQANLGIFDFTLTDADMAAIAGLETGERTGPDPDTFNM